MYKLFDKQIQALTYLKDKETNIVMYGGAARGGKSVLGVIWLIASCQAFPGTRWLMGRKTLKSLKETTLNTFFDVLKDLGMTEQFSYNQQSGVITHINGSQILLKELRYLPSDPNYDYLGSLEITGAFIDEVAQIEQRAVNVVSSRCSYKLKEFDLIPKVYLSCNPTKNWLYKRIYQPSKNGTLENRIKFVQALPTDNPHVPQSYLDNLLTLDEASVQRLYYGNWEYDPSKDAVMDYRAIMGIFGNYNVLGGEGYISCDVARLGSDNAVVCVWEGYRCIEIQSYPKTRINELQDIVKGLMVKYNIPSMNVIADEDGVGGGLVDNLGVNGFVNNSRALNGENYQNLKTQCYYKLADKVNKGEIFITDRKYEAEIVEELEQVRSHKVEVGGKIQMRPKSYVISQINRSPDFSDALMMRLWFDLADVNVDIDTYGSGLI